MSTASNDADDIRRQMALIRRELHEDVRGVVATAEAATDWRRYLTAYPWAALGAAFAAGYLIVPKRRKTREILASVAATHADVSKMRDAVEAAKQTVTETAKGVDEPRKRKRNLIGAALGIVTPLALRAAQGYAMKYLENWVMQQQMAQDPFAGLAPGQPGPATGPRPQPGPTRPTGPRRAGGPGPL